MRCPDCNKFASLETQEPEADLECRIEEGNKSLGVTGTVRMVRTCADCGTELKETTFDVDLTADISDQEIDERAEVDDPEVDVTVEATESGGGRYAKNMIGFEGTVTVSVHWKLGKEEGDVQVEVPISDSLQASAWDELV